MRDISFSGGSLGRVPVLERTLQSSIASIDVVSLLHYGNALGLDELRESLAKLYTGVSKENVLVTSSAQQALEIAIEHSSPRKQFFVQEPAYFGVLRLLRRNPSVNVVPFSTVDSVDDFLNSESVVYVTSNFHNPTGRTLTADEKSHLTRSIVGKGAHIIEDNPHDLLYFSGSKPSNLFELAPAETVYIGGMSKILAPGIRIGYMIADEQVIGKMKSLKIDHDIFTSTLGQYACANALRTPKYLTKLRMYFKEKRDIALSALQQNFGNQGQVTWNHPEGGIFILAELHGISIDDTIKIAQDKYRLCLEKDKFTYVDGKTRNTTRINFVQNTKEDLVEGIQRFSYAVQEAQR